MDIEATISKTWRNRQLLIAAFLAAFGLWFVYDGAIGFPAKTEQFEAHQALKEEGRAHEWEAYSRERGWRRKRPEYGYDADQIRQQYQLGAVAFAGSFVALMILFVSSRRRLRSDGKIICSPNGRKVPIASIISVDKKKWDSKGIAVAHYEEGGRHLKLVIDDYKYAGGDQILKQVEDHLGSQRQMEADREANEADNPGV